jgi:hypothetical protein
MLLLSVLWLGTARGQFLQESNANSFIDSVGGWWRGRTCLSR